MSPAEKAWGSGLSKKAAAVTGHPHLTIPKCTAMALVPPLGREFPPEPVNCPLAAPRELDVVGGTICPAPEEETSRPEQVQASLGLPEHCMGELKSTESATSPSRLPLASSHEHQDGGKPCEVELPAAGPGTRPWVLDAGPQQDCPDAGPAGRATRGR